METNEGKQDSQQEAKAPDAGGDAPKDETFTKAQVEEMLQKDRIARGRDEKSLKEREAKLDAWEKQQEENRRKAEEAEEEKLRDKPDALKILQERRKLNSEREALNAEKSALEQEKAGHTEKLTEGEKAKRELNVFRTAQAKGVDAEVLLAKCEKFKLTAAEDIAEMADTLAAAGGGEKKSELHVDSGKGKGGSGKLTNEKANAMTSDEYIAARKKEDPSLI
jgi:hypothetical protein